MVVLGVLALLLGGALYLSGNSMNNDIDAQMESIFNDGVANPGSSYADLGILLLIVGFALLIIGVVVRKKNEVSPAPKATSLVCKKCGAIVNSEGNFCSHCGELLLPAAGWRCACGHTNDEDDKFCANCGKKKTDIQPERSTWLCSCGATHTANEAFCSKCGNPRVKPVATMLWVCPNCQTENGADHLFCANCRTIREAKNDLS